jgi:hypothetical protein
MSIRKKFVFSTLITTVINVVLIYMLVNNAPKGALLFVLIISIGILSLMTLITLIASFAKNPRRTLQVLVDAIFLQLP